MRVMVVLKGTGANEHLLVPSADALAEMTAYNDALQKAGVFVDADGLRPSSAGAQVVFAGGDTSVVDGPFAEAKEVIAGFWVWEVASLDEAVEWAKRCPRETEYGDWRALEIRPFWESAELEDLLSAQARAGA